MRTPIEVEDFDDEAVEPVKHWLLAWVQAILGDNTYDTYARNGKKLDRGSSHDGRKQQEPPENDGVTKIGG